MEDIVVRVGDKWHNTDVYRQPAIQYMKHGYYTNAVFGSKEYKDYWMTQKDRSVNGYEIGGVRITGPHYFFLNFSPMNIVENPKDKSSKKIWGFPRFWNLHYEFFHALEQAEKAGKHFIILKPRGTGFSEIFSSIAVRDYTLIQRSKSFFFASQEAYLNKDGVLTKAWDKLEFLNQHTARGFRHLRQVKNQDLHKRASYLDNNGNEKGYMSEIIGRVIDHPRKVRGARTGTYGRVYFEECLGKDAQVIMHDLSLKTIQDIVVGDKVMGVDGLPKEVINTTTGHSELYKVSQQKGEDYIVNHAHKLFLEQKTNNAHYLKYDGFKTIIPEEFLSLNAYKRQTAYGRKADALLYDNQQSLQIDPYWLGAWLGDGDKTRASIVVNIEKDIEIGNYIERYAESIGSSVRITGVNTTEKCRKYTIYDEQLQRTRITDALKHYGVHKNKHIPKEYLLSSLENRLELLAGILDTDGYLNKGSSSYTFSYEVTFKDHRLAEDTALLARSCGYYVKEVLKENKQGFGSGIYKRITIRGNLSKIPCKLLRRKIPKDYKPTSNPLNTRISVESIGKGEYFGFTLKAENPDDHLFLLKDFTITHNCGSFPNLRESIQATRPLVEQGGVTTGMIVAWGCVCKGTKVWTKQGKLVNIENLQQSNGIIGYNGTTVSKEPIIWMKPVVKKLCYRITLETGNTIECSHDHPILWTNNSLRAYTPQWKGKKYKKRHRRVAFKSADSIKKGDHILGIDSVPIFGKKRIKDARLLGLLIGDGSYANVKYNIEIVACEQGIKDFVERNYEHTIHKEQVNISDQKVYRAYNLRPLGKIRKLLIDHGIANQKKQLKRLPFDIHTFDKHSLADLLGGYFDADGHVKYDTKRGVSVVLTSAVYPLLEQVKWQLTKFGVHSAITEENPMGGFGDKKGMRHKVYRLYITRDQSVRNFYYNIRFLDSEKQSRLALVNTYRKKVNKKVDKAEFVFDSSTGKGACFKGRKDLSAMQLYKVLSVECIGNQDVYNLTAGKTHTYLANNIITHNTGGEEGKGIEGLDHMFYHPAAYNMFEFDNVWDEDRKGTKSGWFFPVYKAMDRFTDQYGNCDEEAAKKYHENERDRIKAISPKEEDRYRAEYPMSGREALTRMRSNLFPVAELQRQLTRVKTDQGIQGFLKYGWIVHSERGLKFSIDPKALPLKDYPNIEKDTTGCITLVESPYRDQNGKTPDGLYSIVLDSYYKDEATDSESLGAAYVYKHKNNVTESEDSILVCWYVARPNTTQEFNRHLFLMARFYNARIQSEIAGGGKGVIDYARVHKLLHYCELEPDIIYNNQQGTKRNKQYFMNMSKDTVRLALTYLADWLKEERSIKEGPDGEIITSLNLHKIYDQGLLEELIKFNDEANFDRVSALRILPFMIKDRVEQIIQQRRSENSFWDRPLFTDHLDSNEHRLPLSEIKEDLNELRYGTI